MKKRMLALWLVLLLTGCGTTTVYIPEYVGQAEDGVIVYIPMDSGNSSEPETAPAPVEETEREETEPEQKNTATVSKKPSGSSGKGTSSGDQNETVNKQTITGTLPPQTEPDPTEDSLGSGQTTLTSPAETEPPETEHPSPEPPIYDISDYVVGDLEYAMLDRINEYRREEGLEELWLDEDLCAIASCRGYEASLVWSHIRPDGRNWATVLDDYGYYGGATGELLGYASEDAADLVDKWMSSESHRMLLMGSSSTLGIGIYCAGGVIYVACLLIG